MPKKKDTKTNAMRLLDEKNLPYIHHDLHLDQAASAREVADMLGRDKESIFKTLVTRGSDGNHYVFMLPADGRLSLKKGAKAAGVKSIEMIAQKELFPLTGYVHGGCSPLAMKKSFPTFLDETAVLFDAIFFSGGKIGVQIEMDPGLFSEAFHVEMADLCE